MSVSVVRGRLWEKELTAVVPGSEDDDVLAEGNLLPTVILRHEPRRRNQSVAERREGRTRVSERTPFRISGELRQGRA